MAAIACCLQYSTALSSDFFSPLDIPAIGTAYNVVESDNFTVGNHYL